MKFNVRVIPWSLPPHGVLKFNVEGVARGKSWATGIEGFFEMIKESNEANVLVIPEAMRIFNGSFQGRLIVE